MIELEFLRVLRCPQSGGQLTVSPNGDELWCHTNGKAYPIVNNVPILRIDRAKDIPSHTTSEET